VDAILVGPGGAREIDLQLGTSGGRVRGRVLDPNGAPLEHASVSAGPRGGFQISGTSGTQPLPATVETNRSGEFEFVDDIEPGKQPIFATARGFPVWQGIIDVVAGASASIEIRLEPSARIEGRVIGLDGRPIAGIEVIASKEDRGGWYWDGLPPSRATSGEQGRFTLDWLKAGACEIHAYDDVRPEVGRGRADIECIAGQTTNCDVRLDRGNTISGHVVDKDGAPLAGWKVYSHSSDFLNDYYPRHTKTATDGAFTLLNLGTGAHDLIVRGTDMQVAPRAQAFRVQIGTNDVVLVVDDANVGLGTLRARIVDPGGHSLEDLEVTLWRKGNAMGSFLDVDAKTGIVESQVQPGQYRIQVRRSTVTMFVSADFSVAEGQVTEVGDLMLGALGRAEIRITGLPSELERMHLSLEGPGHFESGTLDWDDGVWRSKDLAAGRWLVTSTQEEIWLRGAEIEIPAGATGQFELTAEPAIPVKITFASTGSDNIALEAHDRAGKFLLYQRVGFEDPKGQVHHTIGLPPGRATIEVHTLEGLNGSVDVDVTPKPRGSAEVPPVQIPLH
jgi:protocatechuate 3,4-dioxygenase beta subunit